MKRILLLLLLTGVTGWLYAQKTALSSPSWMRYPAIAPDGKTIAFTYGGMIYTVPVRGGEARYFAGGPGYRFMPVWSHDGKRIAYASNERGNFDVVVRAVESGKTIVLTTHAADEFPFDFSADDSRVLLGSARVVMPDSRQFPLDEGLKLFDVPVQGGRVRSLLSTPVAGVRVAMYGKGFLYEDVKTRENAWRKHQTGSGARDIWLYDETTKAHRQLSFFTGEDRNAVFAPDGKTLYYLSERSGSFNVYQQSIADTVASQVTFHTGQPVRSLSVARNGTICYAYDGQLYVKEKGKQPRQVMVAPISQFHYQQVSGISSYPSAMAVSPSGRELAMIAEGEVFVTTVDSARNRQVSFTAAPEAGISFSPDGKRLLYASERNGHWAIVEATATMTSDSLFVSAAAVTERILIGNEWENYQPKYSPDGQEIAWIENRETLKVYNLRSGESRTILTGRQLMSEADHDQDFSWSPDGQWLLVQFHAPGNGNSEIGVVAASGRGDLVNLSQSGFDDVRPSWQWGGRMITWFSDREGLRGFGRSGKRQEDVYAVFSDDANRWRFNYPDSNTVTVSPYLRDTIDWEKAAARRMRLTAHAGLLSDAILSQDGRYLYRLVRTDDAYDVWRTDLQEDETRQLTTLHAGAGLLQWDPQQRFLYLLADWSITQIDPLSGTTRVIPTTVEMEINFPAQRQYMFDHVWERVATAFYTTGWHGVNWPALRDQYRNYLPGIFNNYDLAEMLNEMLGELNVSHTGVRYEPPGRQKETGSLGVLWDEAYTGPGVRIGTVLERGPLDGRHPLIGHGAVIEAVDSVPVAPDKDITAYLFDKVGKPVRLRVSRAGQTAAVTVTPVSPTDEADLLYLRWMKRNAEEVTKASGGRIGYIHLHRMNDAAYRRMVEEVLGSWNNCAALIVDTRYNRGGNLALELESFLSGRALRTNANDRHQLNTEPVARWTKPSAVLANEANYSDGHCFVYDYQLLRMGTLIGMPVPGSCTWQSAHRLVDRTLTFAMPVTGVKDLAGKYLENQPTRPDREVRNDYRALGEGRDQQLEMAIQVLLQQLTEQAPGK